MKTIWKLAATLAVLAVVAIFVCFRVSFKPQFELPHTVRHADPAQEKNYTDCVAARDRQAHQVAFDTIHNPDVRREYIDMHHESAENDCRQQYPRQMTTVEQGLRFNLFDLESRFGLHYPHDDEVP